MILRIGHQFYKWRDPILSMAKQGDKTLIGLSAGLIVCIFLVLILIHLGPIINWMDRHGGIVSFLSILVAIGIFLRTRASDRSKHKRNQILKLRSLLREVRLVKQHLRWLKDRPITDHFIHEIDPNFYNNSLDSEIAGEFTIDIIVNLFKLGDKIKLINYYGRKKRDYSYSEWEKDINKKKKKKDKEDHDIWIKKFVQEDKVIPTFQMKSLLTINEAEIVVQEIECILKERFKIK